MNALDYFKENVGGKVLDVYEGRNFTDIIAKRGGDLVSYRVRESEEGFAVCER